MTASGRHDRDGIANDQLDDSIAIMLNRNALFDQASSLKQAVIGTGITLAAVTAIAAIQILYVPHTLATMGNLDPSRHDWAVSAIQRDFAKNYSLIFFIIIVYWSLMAVFGKGQFLKIRISNTVLVISCIAFAIAIASASTVPGAERLFKGACPILFLADSSPELPSGIFGFDRKTECEAFANKAVPIVLLGTPLLLLLISGVQRIVISRRLFGESIC